MTVNAEDMKIVLLRAFIDAGVEKVLVSAGFVAPHRPPVPGNQHDDATEERIFHLLMGFGHNAAASPLFSQIDDQPFRFGLSQGCPNGFP